MSFNRKIISVAISVAVLFFSYFGADGKNNLDVNQSSTVIHFGSSSVTRYAASELHKYLQLVTGEIIALDDPSVKEKKVYQPKSYAEEIQQAEEIIKQRKKPVKKKIQDENFTGLPGFILGTPQDCPMIDRSLLIHKIPKNSDGYYIKTSKDGKKVFIAAWKPRGVLYGVYDYLRTYCGIGFFEDGERIPSNLTKKCLPPFIENYPEKLEIPHFSYRGQWIWTRYYGADRGHPLTWDYEQWRSHLRWLAQQGFNTVLVYPVGYTRLWGDVFQKAFPETKKFVKEVNEDAEDFWGAHYSVQAGWGRAPEETTQLMKRVYKFGRENLGLVFEYNFYLGSFQEELKLAYPEGKWISWENVPHHAYYGAAGRSPVLSFTDPRCKKYFQRLFKEFIKTYGTDHRYWIAYREESEPDPNNPFDPDRGRSSSEAVDLEAKWIKEIDPEAEFFHWDWTTGWGKVKPDGSFEYNTHTAMSYCRSIPDYVTIANIVPPGTEISGTRINPPPDKTYHFKHHPWIIGSLIGYAGLDIGLGGIGDGLDSYFKLWKRWINEEPAMGNRLRGVLHWNEIIQVNPLLDYLIGEFAWTGKPVGTVEDLSLPSPRVKRYYELRYGREDAPVMLKAAKKIYSNFPAIVPNCRTPEYITKKGASKDEKYKLNELKNALKTALSIRHSQAKNILYQRELMDFGRIVLHISTRVNLEEAIKEFYNYIKLSGRGKGESGEAIQHRKKFFSYCNLARASITTLADILATDERHCLRCTIQRMCSEPGANRLLRLMILEHASGQLFNNYALNDTPEYFYYIGIPRFEKYISALKSAIDSPQNENLLVRKYFREIDAQNDRMKEILKDADKKDELQKANEEFSKIHRKFDEGIGLSKIIDNFYQLAGADFQSVKMEKTTDRLLSNWLSR